MGVGGVGALWGWWCRAASGAWVVWGDGCVGWGVDMWMSGCSVMGVGDEAPRDEDEGYEY